MGVGIYIQEDLAWDPIPISDNLLLINKFNVEICAIRTRLGGTIFNIFSIYIPSNKMTLQIPHSALQQLYDSISGPSIFLGDWNAHLSEVGNNHTCKFGKTVREWLDTNHLVLLNDESITHVPSNGNSPSSIDLAICTNSLSCKMYWETFQSLLTSDHYPCIVTIIDSKLDAFNSEKYRIRKWKIKQGNWNLFRKIFDSLIDKIPKIVDVHLEYSTLLTIINTAMNSSCPVYTKKSKHRYPGLMWWSDECQNSYKDKKAALEQYLKNPNSENLIKYKKNVAIMKRMVKFHKRKAWQSFCNKLNIHTSLSEVWNILRKVKNPRKASPKPLDNKWQEEFIQKVQAQNNIHEINEPDRMFTFTPNRFFDKPLYVPFSVLELQLEINNLKNSAPGKDHIENLILQNMSSLGIQWLCTLFNKIFLTGIIPHEWADYIMVPILKPGKPASSGVSYRPVCLASNLLKLFERMILKRLEWFLESNQKFLTNQFGFRKNTGSQDAIATITLNIHNNLSQGKKVHAVFLDLTTAFDSINPNILLDIMIQNKIPYLYLKIIRNLLNNRKIQFFFDDQLKQATTISTGTSQGSPLSPLLFNLYMSPLKSFIPPCFEFMLFADDLVIMIPEEKNNQNFTKLENFIIQLTEWFKKQKSHLIGE